MTYLSVCSGIEAATTAWHPIGWKPLAFSEIEPFPSAVLAHHWPDVPNLGDMTKHNDWPNTLRPNIIVGGTPCQAFSVAGLRKGLADPRGNLTLVFLGILAQYRPTWMVWENVPGVLSDRTGAFGAFLGGLGKLGYGFAYRVLDAQYFGVAQRRRRVFVVGHLGGWRRAAAVLFERESLLGDSPPSREKGQAIAPTIRAGAANGGAGHGARIGDSKDELIVPVLANPLTARMHKGINTTCDEGQTMVAHTTGAGFWKEGFGTLRAREQDSHENLVAHSLRGEGFDASEDGTGRGTSIVPTIAFERRMVRTSGGQPQEKLAHCLRSDANSGDGAPCVAFSAGNSKDARSIALSEEHTPPLRAGASGTNMTPTIMTSMQVRRLTPRECERLQGFPDDHTLIPWRGKMAPDGPRYKALGNSMAVPVMRWIGERISQINAL